MGKKRNSTSVSAGRPGPARPATATRPSPAKPAWFSAAWIREGIESLAVAFILAFLFRGFEAEAFVIPTGSMAPTLMGAHKDLLCPQCGYRYQAGASSESEDQAQQMGRKRPVQEIVAVSCPLCRFTTSVDQRTEQGRENPTFGGDRILVEKFNVEFSNPHRWDITVFKYPADAKENYIKRLVGLPHETVRIWQGDLYFKGDGEEEFHFEHRAPGKLRAMAQIVYDNDYVVGALTEKGWPVRWNALDAQASSTSSWTSKDGSRTYETAGSSGQTEWLAYQHFVPSVNDWERLKKSALPEGYRPRPRLITDYVAYNSSVPRGEESIVRPTMAGLHWVGDLMLECDVNVTNAEGTAIIELVKGGRHFRCSLDCATGQAQLSIDGLDDYKPTAQTSFKGTGSHRVALANFDCQLVLWLDGSPVTFDVPTTYAQLGNDRPESSAEDLGDMAPARIGSQGTGMKVSHLRLSRDIYYIAVGRGNWMSDYSMGVSYDELVEFWSTPKLWQTPGERNLFDHRNEALFALASDQFFMLGDNSPMSMDARLWDGEQYVSRELLVGKAIYIFWPHSFDKFPGTNIPFPFFPNFARMRLIR